MTSVDMLRPRPGPAPRHRQVFAQAAMELRLSLRNGEQLLLTLVIPLVLLVGLTRTSVVEVGAGERINVVAPGVLALAIMSTAFTSQAIATGFERRYGVLKRLGATPMPRSGLLAGKTVAVLAIEMVQLVLLTVVALILGWRPEVSAVAAVLLVLAGTAAFSGLALLMAGTLRAEATLAVANLVYLVMLIIGGVIVPLGRYPSSLQGPLSLLPPGALTEGLRHALTGSGSPWGALGVLVAWGVGLLGLAARTFRWE